MVSSTSGKMIASILLVFIAYLSSGYLLQPEWSGECDYVSEIFIGCISFSLIVIGCVLVFARNTLSSKIPIFFLGVLGFFLVNLVAAIVSIVIFGLPLD